MGKSCNVKFVLLIGVLLLAAIEYGLTSETQCSARPLDTDEDTLCGVTNTTTLKCHAQRVGGCREDGSHWTSVCLFKPEETIPIQRDFLDNHGNYDCHVKGDFGPANCTSKLNPRKSFKAACNYTFYFCELGDPLMCLEEFSSELEVGGKCPPPEKLCPSDNLFSLTNSFTCLDGVVKPISYNHLRRPDIGRPFRCTNGPTLAYALSFAVIFVLLLAAIFVCLLCQYRKLKAGVIANMHEDPVIKMGEKIFAEPDAFLEFQEVSDEEQKVDPFIPKSYIGKPSTPTDSRHYKPLINNDNDVESTQESDFTSLLDSKQNDAAVSIVNLTYKPMMAQDYNYENTKAVDDQNVALFKNQDYSQNQPKNEVELPSAQSFPNPKVPLSAVPKYVKENEPIAFHGYLKKTADYAEYDSTDPTAVPNYLHKTDLTDTGGDVIAF